MADDVDAFINAIENPTRKADANTLLEIFQRVTKQPAKFWPPSIIGFGDYHYKYDSGREGDFFRLGFSSRVQNISIYIMPGYQDFNDELTRLGKHKMGKSCLYIKRLSDVNEAVLIEIMKKGLAIMAEKYPL